MASFLDLTRDLSPDVAQERLSLFSAFRAHLVEDVRFYRRLVLANSRDLYFDPILLESIRKIEVTGRQPVKEHGVFRVQIEFVCDGSNVKRSGARRNQVGIDRFLRCFESN